MKLSDYEQPSVTADIVIFSVIDEDLKVLLVKRGIEPFKDKWAIPGGFMNVGESLEDAAKRELFEETGVKDVYLEQLYTFGDVGRDPRGRVVTVSYFALVNSEKIKLKSSADVKEAKWFSVKKLPTLAFDHKKILDYALQRLKWKFEYTTVGISLLSKKFRLSELRGLYEIVFDREFDKRNFVKKIHALKVLDEVGVDKDVPYRPPKLYSLKKGVRDFVEII
ncbi:NUDIX hydrolase [archaeon]|jgi:8-oxo-dGTP diphosphatase|nr:NUDIX hydrolase [archaeon]